MADVKKQRTIYLVRKELFIINHGAKIARNVDIDKSQAVAELTKKTPNIW